MKYFFFLFIFIAIQNSCVKKTPEIYYQMGEDEMLKTNSYVAINYFTKAIREKHDYKEAYQQRASVYLVLDSIDATIRDYDTLLVLTKGDQQKQGYLHYLKGNALYLNSADSSACSEWRKSRDLNYLGAWNKIRSNCK